MARVLGGGGHICRVAWPVARSHGDRDCDWCVRHVGETHEYAKEFMHSENTKTPGVLSADSIDMGTCYSSFARRIHESCSTTNPTCINSRLKSRRM